LVSSSFIFLRARVCDQSFSFEMSLRGASFRSFIDPFFFPVSLLPPGPFSFGTGFCEVGLSLVNWRSVVRAFSPPLAPVVFF